MSQATSQYVNSSYSSLRSANTRPRLPPVRACLFDMDGLLIDSEDLYTVCTNETLRKYGKPDLPWNIKAQLQGRPGPEVCTRHLPRKKHIGQQLTRTRRPVRSSTIGPNYPLLAKTSSNKHRCCNKSTFPRHNRYPASATY